MEELRRVLINKKFIIGLVVLLILNGWIVYKETKSNKVDKTYIEGYKEMIAEYKDVDYEKAINELNSYIEEEENKILYDNFNGNILFSNKYFQYKSLVAQLEYINDYNQYLDGVGYSAEKLLKTEVFGNENSFSKNNIEKTALDFGKMKGLDLSLEYEDGFSLYRNGMITGILLMIMPIIIVLIYMEERKKGLWQFIYSLRGGTYKLAAIRVGILSAIVAVVAVLLEIERIGIIAYQCGDLGDLTRAVQSNPEFSSCVLRVSVGEFIVISLIIKILAGIMLGCLLWILANVIKNNIAVISTLIVFLAGEYWAYESISVHSNFNIIKFVNIFSFIDSSNVLGKYYNVNILNKAVGLNSLIFIVLPIIILVMMCACILLGKKKPFNSKDGFISIWIGRLKYKLKLYSHFNLCMHEGYKIIVQQKVWIIMVIMIAYLCNPVEKKDIFYDYSTTLYNNYMEQLAGEYSQIKKEYLETELASWTVQLNEHQSKIDEYEELLQKGSDKAKEIFATEKDYKREMSLRDNKQIGVYVTSNLLEETAYMEEKIQKGINCGYVNRIGYEEYFGINKSKDNQMNVLIMLMFSIAMIGGIQSYEKSQNSVTFMRSTIRGRKHVFDMKCIWIIILNAIVVASVCIRQIIECEIQFGLEGMNYSIHSLEFLREFPVNVSILQMIIILNVTRYIMMICVSGVVLLISGRCNNVLISLLVSILVLLVPAGLVYASIDVVSYISVMNAVEITKIWIGSGFKGMMWIVPNIILLVLGVSCYVWQRRKA